MLRSLAEENYAQRLVQFRKAYTVIGDGVNLASRLEALCRRYSVDLIVGETTYKNTKNDFLYLHLDRVKVKGKHLAENIYLPIVPKEESSSILENLVCSHHAALDAYFKQEWQQASKQFNRLAKDSPYIKLCQLFIERIDSYKENAPGPNWDGSFELKSKN